jgi:uncharacterized protein YbjT (DUF2867 family)
MKVLVTGGTGFVGREIVQALRTEFHAHLRLLVRDPERAAKAFANPSNIEFCRGDILNVESLKQFCSPGDAVIHLVGIISEAGRNTYETIHTSGTRNVVAAAKAAGITRFIQMSALGTRPDAVARYHRSKWAAEEFVRQSGLDYTIFRPSIIYGQRDQFTNLFARLSRVSPIVPVMGPGTGTFQPIPVGDVARSFCRSIGESKAIGQTFDLGSAEVLTMNAVLDTIFRATGRSRAKLHVPVPVARGLAAFLEFAFPTFLRKAPPLNRDQITMLQEQTVGNVKPALELFGIHPPPFRDGIAAYL